MSYINLASANKLARASQINTAIGTGGNMLLYTGSPPLSPDYPVTGSLLVSLPLSSPAATASYTVANLIIVAPGSGGTNGAQMVTGTTGTGIRFQASVTITGGAITAILALVNTGAYSVLPTALANEPVIGVGLVGATVGLVMTGQLIFGPITQSTATGSGIAGYARIQSSAGLGIVDLDCGTANSSVIMNTTTIAIGGPVLCSADVLVEA